MFQKNIEVLETVNSSLAAKLKAMKLKDVKNIETFKAESNDIVISFNGVPLHNLVDPIRESRVTWNKTVRYDPRKNDIQIVFGLGLGYLFKRAYVSANSKIFIYEPFIDVLRFVFEYVDFSKELSDSRVYISANLNDLIEKISSQYLSGDRIEFLFLNSYMALAQSKLKNLTDRVLEVCESKQVDQNTIFHQCKFWTRNSILNMPYLSESLPVGFISDAFADKPALIISAGPSLAQNLQKIKENKDKFIIIAVCSVLKTLVQEGIKPDFVCFSDPNYIEKHVEGIEDQLSDINLVLNSRAESCVLDKKFKTKLMWFSNTDVISEWVEDKANINIGLNNSGGTVSILSYYFAKAIGCNPIIFAGLDLSFIDNKTYVDGTELKFDAQGNIDIGYMPAYDFKKLIYVKGANGEMVPTRDDYAVFIRQFNDILANEPDNNLKTINTSLSGAYIEGMEYIAFDDVIKTLGSPIIEVDKAISDIKNNNKDRWQLSCQSIYSHLVIQKAELDDIYSLTHKIYTELEEICKLFDESDNVNNSLEFKLNSIKEDVGRLRKYAIDNTFLSNYLQPEIWQYIQSYNTNAISGLKEIKHNIKVETEFFRMIFWAVHNTREWLNTAIQKYNSIPDVSMKS